MNVNRSVVLAVIVLAFTSSAYAQLETISPLTINPSQSVTMVWPNLLPPDPDYKELQFIGTATTVPGAFAILQIDFDYIDNNGNNIVVPAPIPQFTVIGGQVNPIDTLVYTIPFCPQVVSLHLTNVANAASVPLTVSGTFRHECVPVPEPSGLALAVLGGLGLCCWGRKYRPKCPA
ncbi:MAG: hypothetical protein K1X74_22190 [Pirellulales bacterium]|nr:hypothetical protein [Pirellulales bacterium]